MVAMIVPYPAGPVDGMQQSLYDRYAALYADFRLHHFPDDRATVAAALDLPGARRLAELGCGPGLYATALAAAYPRLDVTGIDRASAQIALARERAPRNARFTVGDVRALTQPDAAFDRVLASRLLMVVPERKVALEEMRRVLAPGGILLLAEPIAPRTGVLHLLRRVAQQRGDRRPDSDPPMEYLFTAATFRTLVSSQRWASVAIWEANGYRYARCRATNWDRVS